MSKTLHPLTAYRARANISLAKLAEMVGTTRQSLFRIERGSQNPSFEMILNITTATNGEVTANDFMPAATPSPHPEAAPAGGGA